MPLRLGVGRAMGFAKLDKLNFSIAKLHRPDFRHELFLQIFFILLVYCRLTIVGKDSLGIGREQSRPEMLARLPLFHEVGA